MKRMTLAILLVAASLGAAQVVSADQDNAPGAYCMGTNDTLTVNTAGHAYNNTTSEITAVCPIERRELATKVKALVFVLDRHPDENVCCRLIARSPNGHTYQTAETCSSGSSSSEKHFTTEELDYPWTYAQFFVKCTLPPKSGSDASRILTYRSYLSN